MRSSMLAACVVAAVSAFAQPSVTVGPRTQTQAVLKIQGATGGCTIAVSEIPDFSVLHPDVDPSEYPGASVDTSRADTITQSDGSRLVTIGHMNDDRALAAATPYFWQVSGCGATVAGSFVTANLMNGSTQQWPVPFNPNHPWNFGYPQVNLVNPSPVVDPVSGVKLVPVNTAADWGWRTGGGGSGPQANTYQPFLYWTGGSGWSNPGNVLNGRTSTASTSNTNPIDLYFTGTTCCGGAQMTDPWNGLSIDDMGIVPWAGSTDTSGSNPQFTVQLLKAGVPVGSAVTITAPGTFGQILSGSPDPDQPFPASFPSAFFSGWGMTAPLGPDYTNVNGITSCASAVCTIAANAINRSGQAYNGGNPQGGHFPNMMAAGMKIYIAGSSPTCTNNLCTLSTYQNAAQITLAENLTISNAQFVALMTGVRVTKLTSTGTLTVGLAYKQAGSRTLDINGPGQWNCSTVPFTSGDGHLGYLCTSQVGVQSGGGYMYFVSGDGAVRRIWSTRIPSASSCFLTGSSTSPSADQPSGQGSPLNAQPPVTWSTIAGNVFYVAVNNQSGSSSIYKVTYTGDATNNLPPTNYSADFVGDMPLFSSPCDQTSWVNLLPPSTSNDLNSQIGNRFPSYNSSLYGGGSAFALQGNISGTTAFLNNNYSGQNNPAWIAVVDLGQNPAALVNMIHTLDGTGTTGATTAIGPAAIRWGGHHNTTALGSVANTAVFTEDMLINQNTNVMFSGPFVATPLAKLNADCSTWNTNTSLPWPPDTSYCTTFGGSNPYAAWIYATSPNSASVTNAYVTFVFPQGGVCNSYPSTTEKANFPACPWNSSYTQPVSLAVGDNFGDTGCGSTPGSDLGDFGDCEHFRIVAVSTIASGPYAGDLQVVAMRNAIFDYCGAPSTYFPGTPIANGVGAGTQYQHINSWQAAMLPPRLNGCNTGTFFYQWGSTPTLVEQGRLEAGHGGLYPGITSGKVSFVASTISKPDSSFTTVFSLPTTYYNLSAPTFQGTSLAIGGGAVQSYTTTPGGVPWMVDTNALNGNYGSGPELAGNNIGAVTLTNVTGNVYTISVLGVTLNNLNYKTFPLNGWAGRYLLHDVSGPTSSIDSSPWGMCYAYNAGECHSGSNAGTLYVNIPGAYNSGTCNTGQSFLIAPCVVIGMPSGGGFRRQEITRPDPSGTGTQFITYALTAPGEHYPYSEGLPLADASAALLPSHQAQGWGPMGLLVKLPPWTRDSKDRTRFAGLPVQVPPGPAYVEVQFGYSRYIGPNVSPVGNFYCTPRAETCNTSGSPFNFGSETPTLASCGNGCMIALPVVEPNLVYYRIRRSSDGINWSVEDVQVAGRP